MGTNLQDCILAKNYLNILVKALSGCDLSDYNNVTSGYRSYTRNNICAKFDDEHINVNETNNWKDMFWQKKLQKCVKRWPLDFCPHFDRSCSSRIPTMFHEYQQSQSSAWERKETNRPDRVTILIQSLSFRSTLLNMELLQFLMLAVHIVLSIISVIIVLLYHLTLKMHSRLAQIIMDSVSVVYTIEVQPGLILVVLFVSL